MEAIITIVGFLGAGKTTLLKHLVTSYIKNNWNPFIVLNDYENANLDALQLIDKIDPKWIRALTGSCICCSGINELRDHVNRIPVRTNGVTLIEANGTSDACALMEFLGVGLNDRFLPPIQISVVDVKNWQKRGEYDELEANQVQVSSLIILTHLEKTTKNRQTLVRKELKALNRFAKILTMDEIDATLLRELLPSKNIAQKLDHQKAHWSSCSTDLPDLPNLDCIYTICNALPKSILRVKGCTKIGDEKKYTYFERNPDGQVFIRPFNGIPITGPKLLTVGPGSESSLLEKVIQTSLKK
ncbi:cobalamin biosynthesis protein CobW [Aquimarina sp. AD1]|uniref:GTP-binding protein n=1 Tax=Aquimarina sp. (strain AD1) TaxID=1714848 RepID=UPI000E4B2B13|nr:GTP-binding protein [Aquimarina sp. AD1]AXT54521.1 cobalamin biosynthesis protein CobW [Aquimarina sp. AD1]RKN20210.1 cobalamin biosynthesis protein CobW [Aquimarina sp. AD1]